MSEDQFDIAIIGGGPAGSTLALYLSRGGYRVCVVEKRIFPRETLCGEFLSREVVRIIEDLQLAPEFQMLRPNPITTFRFCPETDQTFTSQLPFMAYGLKRGSFDTMLLDQAQLAGAFVYQPMTVERVNKTDHGFLLHLSGAEGKRQIRSRYVVCAYGKTDPFDKTLQKNIPKHHSRLLGVKFHIHKKHLRNMPDHEIHMYTGHTMYCGINMVNDDTVTLCFLEGRTAADVHPRAKVKELLKINNHFAELVSADFVEMLSSFPIYGASGIYFGKKQQILNGMFMTGDAAQVIAPLAGDGIGMAMESAQILASVLEDGQKTGLNGDALLVQYRERWKSSFQKRITYAKRIQQLFFSMPGKKMGGAVLSIFPSLLPYMIEHTRG